MKKFMSVFLAVIMMFSIALPVFAAEGEVKDVDNTFDNFEPAPGKKAPDNWYDPWSYDAEGHILSDALHGDHNGLYCKTYNKYFTVKRVAKTDDGYLYTPYVVITDILVSSGEIYKEEECEYCPYCGNINNGFTKDIPFGSAHEIVNGVLYGFYCANCDGFNADSHINPENKEALWCWHCADYCPPTVVYRFITEEQRNSSYSSLFTDTEYKYGEGKDGRVEDIKFNRGGYAKDWNNPDNPNQKLTFWQKIVKFFANIMNWIKNLFK